MKKIAFLTDTHLGQQVFLINEGSGSEKMVYREAADAHQENLRTVLNDIVKKGISEVVFGGDIGSEKSNQHFFDLMNTYRLKPRIILGNHDTYAIVSTYYRHEDTDDTQELKYAQEDEHYKYIYLDTSSNSISGTQLAWFKNELRTEKKVIIFIHHPILGIITPIDHLGAALGRRDELKQVLLTLKNEVTIFCGHYHMEDRCAEQNIIQYSTPACAYQIEKTVPSIMINDRIFGYRIITIEDNQIGTMLVNFDK